MDFITDSETRKCTIDFANEIKRKFKFLLFYNKSAIDNFIGKYFAMKADVNEYQYQQELGTLLKINTHLFQILDKFWNKWIIYDIENYSNNDYWEDDFVGEFIELLENWIRKRIIV